MTLPAFPGISWPGLTFPGVGAMAIAHATSAPPRTLEALLSGSHRRLVEATILTGPATGQTLPVIDGSLTFEEDAAVRLTGSVTVAAVDPWTAQDVTAALSPRHGTELQIRHGVLDDAGVEHWWPLGIVRPTRHALTLTADEISVTLTVIDRSGAMAGAGADAMTIIAAGDGIAEGVTAALLARFPWMPVLLDLDDDTEATTDIMLAEHAGDDLWAGCREVMHSVGRNLHVDERGAAVAPLRVAARALAPIDVPVTGVSMEVDSERIVHRVAARVQVANPDFDINDLESEPFVIETVFAEDTDAIAALPPHVPVRTVAYSGDETLFTSPSQAYLAAAAQLAEMQDVVASGACLAVPHPAVMPGAVLSPLGDGERYRITRMTLNLAGGPVDVALGNASRTLSTRLAERFGGLSAGPSDRMEVVASVDPLRTRPLTAGPDEPALLAEDFVSGQFSLLTVGELVNVVHYGRGRRAVTSRWSRPIA